jgi:SGNH domain-containing protein
VAPAVLVLAIALGAGPALVSGAATPPRGPSPLPALHALGAAIAVGLTDNVATPPISSQLSGNAYAWIPKSQCLTTAIESTNATPCVLGDTSATTTVVLLGDSSADEWALDLGALATTAGFRLVVYVHSACPVGAVTVALYGEHPDPSCPAFRSLVLADLAGMHPAPVLVLASELRLSNYVSASGGRLSNTVWTKALTKSLDRIEGDGIPVAVVHGVPITPFDPAGCIAAYPTDMTHCVVLRKAGDPGGYDRATLAGARAAHAAGVDVAPLFCTTTACPVVVSDDVTHSGDNHVTELYAATTTAALAELIGCTLTQSFSHRAAAHHVLGSLLGGTPSAAVLRACRALTP